MARTGGRRGSPIVHKTLRNKKSEKLKETQHINVHFLKSKSSQKHIIKLFDKSRRAIKESIKIKASFQNVIEKVVKNQNNESIETD